MDKDWNKFTIEVSHYILINTAFVTDILVVKIQLKLTNGQKTSLNI